ncbi:MULTISPECIES: hypothetical protein [unclassified Fusibacter]|uniref:hypothetical protein n=1 Tax=unclassified Fusibacter TaxID=2624464 RepID=UPI0013E928BC|nr:MULTISPECIES: hypothetical protein [unclassified Fusibacter]MCK8059908.1 hypothetical protein [Fusibacter sp. A2]NPE22050.1 hypothetical protein [Fusibacter sp. A1]
MDKIKKTKTFSEIFILFLVDELEHRANEDYNDSKLEMVTSKNSENNLEVEQ